MPGPLGLTGVAATTNYRDYYLQIPSHVHSLRPMLRVFFVYTYSVLSSPATSSIELEDMRMHVCASAANFCPAEV